jgi:hypothetical protein
MTVLLSVHVENTESAPEKIREGRTPPAGSLPRFAAVLL